MNGSADSDQIWFVLRDQLAMHIPQVMGGVGTSARAQVQIYTRSPHLGDSGMALRISLKFGVGLETNKPSIQQTSRVGYICMSTC